MRVERLKMQNLHKHLKESKGEKLRDLASLHSATKYVSCDTAHEKHCLTRIASHIVMNRGKNERLTSLYVNHFLAAQNEGNKSLLRLRRVLKMLGIFKERTNRKQAQATEHDCLPGFVNKYVG